MSTQVLRHFFDVDRQACRTILRDKYVRNHYKVTYRDGSQSTHQLTVWQAKVISAACHYNMTLYRYLQAIENGES